MYTTKRINSRRADEGYVSINNPYGVKEKPADRIIGKQFLIAKIKTGQGGFSDMKVAPEPYSSSKGYRVEQPLETRKLAFGSHDAQRRDEFSLQIRQDQYKENINKETDFMSKIQKKNEEAAALKRTAYGESLFEDLIVDSEESKNSADWFQANVPTALYDIHNSPNGRTSLCNKCSRETFFCNHKVKKKLDETSIERRLGGVQLSSAEYGTFNSAKFRLTAPTASKSALGRSQEVRSRTFVGVGESAMQRKSLTPTAKQMSTKTMPNTKVLQSNEFFSASPYGRKHTMAEFYDPFHLAVRA